MNPKTNPSPRDAAPSSPVDPEAMMKLMQELPEACLLAWQQVMAGAPSTTPSPAGTAQPSMHEPRVPGAPPGGPSEPPHQAFSRMQSEALDFWRRSLGSFAKGLSMPPRDRQG